MIKTVSEVFPVRFLYAHKRFFLRLSVLIVQAAAYNVQMLEFLPVALQNAVKRTGIENVYELRVRADCAVTASIRGKYVYFGENGAVAESKNAFVYGEREIADMIYGAGNYSVYSVEEQLRRGFVTASGGVRVGIAGEYVFENGKVLALKRATSICVRIPHRVPGAATKIYEATMKKRMKNVLIFSAPGRGKTTILRDLAEKIAVRTSCNVLVCDERDEIASCGLLSSADVLSYVDKKQAFEMALRALRPDVIITDELSEADCEEVKRAIRGGAYVVATAHYSGVSALPESFRGVFDVYAALSDEGIGNIEGLYDKNLFKIG